MADAEVHRIVDWVTEHGFERIALQFPDAMLDEAPHMISRVQQQLPDKRAFILGDSSFGGGGVDEVGALHYGADCIVRFGHTEQQRGGDLPVLFVFGEQRDLESVSHISAVASTIRSTAENKASGASWHISAFALGTPFRRDGESFSVRVPSSLQDALHLLVICDLPYQHTAVPIAKTFLQKLSGGAKGKWRVLVAELREEASAGEILPRWYDWRWGTLDLVSSWWAGLGTLSLAAACRPVQLKVCGRPVRVLKADGSLEICLHKSLSEAAAIVYVGQPSSTLERCLLLRFGALCPIWRFSGQGEDVKINGGSLELERIFSHSLLQKRYRYVEAAKSAATVGILLVAAGGPTTLGRALAQRLEILLTKSGRKNYRFVVGQPTQEKLGNFPEVECYVLLSGPEQFTWDVQDLMVPICTPFELEVALGARQWTAEYITDLEELLLSAPMTHSLSTLPAAEEVVVQTLGKSRIKSFTPVSQASSLQQPQQSVSKASRPKPASITPGLHGVPWKYSQEEGPRTSD